MWFPRLAYYSIEELVELWGISAELIRKYTERRQLSYETLYHDEYYNDVWVTRDAPPGEPYQYHQFRTWFLRGQFYKLEEVERFEREHPEEVAGDQEERQTGNLVQEKDSEMFTRLKLERTEDVEIAGMLKEAFPRITPHRIGKLITGKPGDIVSTDAYRKRGGKLLKLYSKKQKQ